MVVAVSEETGSISHAYKGQFVRGVTAEQLRAFLTSVLVNPGKQHSLLRLLRPAAASINAIGAVDAAPKK